MEGYIRLADLGEYWTVTHPEAIRRLREEGGPEAQYTHAGADGAWWTAPFKPVVVLP